MTSRLNWLFFTTIQRDKFKWVYIVLIEVYLKAANWSSNKLYTFESKINLAAISEKTIFWSICFTVCVSLWDWSSTKLSRPFFGNLPAIFFWLLFTISILIIIRIIVSFIICWILPGFKEIHWWWNAFHPRVDQLHFLGGAFFKPPIFNNRHNVAVRQRKLLWKDLLMANVLWLPSL